MKEFDVSVIIPSYGKRNNKPLINMLRKTTNKKIEFIVVKGKGIAEAYNMGIKKAKSNIIITFHEDCYPITKGFIDELIGPLKWGSVTASMSKVYDFYTKKEYYPLLDGKATAYKKEYLEKVGLFDENMFKTGGEDYDMYMKLKKFGFVEYPYCTIIHKHKNHRNKKKVVQLAYASGILFRRYGVNYDVWWKCIGMANPINWDYMIAFYKGFFKGDK